MKDKAEDLLWVSQVVFFQNKNAFENLVKKYQSPLRRFFLNLTSADKVTSDDLSQETFIKAYLHLSSFKGTAMFSTWLFRIGYNVFYDSIRSKKIIAPLEVAQQEAFINEDIIESNTAIDMNMDLQKAMQVLREEEKTAVILFYMEGFTHPQIVDVMNCPIGTVKSYLLRGKAKLHKHFKNSGYGSRNI